MGIEDRKLVLELVKSYAEALTGTDDPDVLVDAVRDTVERGEDFEDKYMSDRAYSIVSGVMDVIERKVEEETGEKPDIRVNLMSFMDNDDHDLVAYDSQKMAVIYAGNVKGMSKPLPELVDKLVYVWNRSIPQVEKVYGVKLPAIEKDSIEMEMPLPDEVEEYLESLERNSDNSLSL